LRQFGQSNGELWKPAKPRTVLHATRHVGTRRRLMIEPAADAPLPRFGYTHVSQELKRAVLVAEDDAFFSTKALI